MLQKGFELLHVRFTGLVEGDHVRRKVGREGKEALQFVVGEWVEPIGSDPRRSRSADASVRQCVPNVGGKSFSMFLLLGPPTDRVGEIA